MCHVVRPAIADPSHNGCERRRRDLTVGFLSPSRLLLTVVRPVVNGECNCAALREFSNLVRNLYAQRFDDERPRHCLDGKCDAQTYGMRLAEGGPQFVEFDGSGVIAAAPHQCGEFAIHPNTWICAGESVDD